MLFEKIIAFVLKKNIINIIYDEIRRQPKNWKVITQNKKCNKKKNFPKRDQTALS